MLAREGSYLPLTVQPGIKPQTMLCTIVSPGAAVGGGRTVFADGRGWGRDILQEVLVGLEAWGYSSVKRDCLGLVVFTTVLWAYNEEK